MFKTETVQCKHIQHSGKAVNLREVQPPHHRVFQPMNYDKPNVATTSGTPWHLLYQYSTSSPLHSNHIFHSELELPPEVMPES